LVPGGIYNVAFAIHTGQVTVRDHYVGFAKTLSWVEGPQTSWPCRSPAAEASRRTSPTWRPSRSPA
jgi:hypothetical protein